MDNNEVRYAIVIGINDYENSPLNFCVNDAMDIKKSLIENCMFDEQNVFVITSNNENSQKDITGKYLETIRVIKQKFIEQRDSILFYFAGHGSCKNNKSVVWYQQSSYPIEDIFKNICELNPKIQTYIIDACNSGSKVLTRDKESDLEKYIRSANGAMFLYACQNTEYASELAKLEHGLLTYRVLEAINNKKLYDDEGYLTFNRIVENVQREIPKETNFSQIPVIENRITGFYPFAIDKSVIKEGAINEEKSNISLEKNINRLRNIRLDIMTNLIKNLEESLEESIQNTNYNGYKIENSKTVREFEDYNIENLEKAIVEYVEKEKLIPLGDLIYKKVEKKNYNKLFGGIMSSMNWLNNLPDEVTHYNINFSSERLKSRFKICLSENINEVSFGVGYICYQAKWGVVALKIGFLIDWNGETCNIIKDISIKDVALSLEEKSMNVVKKNIINFKEFIEELVYDWNANRKEELERYRTFI